MIDELIENIENEIKMVRELSGFIERTEFSSVDEKKLLESMIGSYKRRIKLINDSVVEILKDVSLIRKIPGKKSSANIFTLEVNEAGPDSKVKLRNNGYIKVSLRGQDKDKFLEELSISEELLRKLKRKDSVKEDKIKEYKKSAGFAKFSNSLFRNFSEELLEKGKFAGLRLDLRKSNMNILPTTYLSMMFVMMIVAGIIGIGFTVFLLFFNVEFSSPYLTSYAGSIGMRILKVSWIILAAPLLMFAAFYFYPYTEKKSLGSKIDRELPFVAIHMASISGSGIEPTQIFKIIGTSKEYRNTGSEIRKLLNQINVYGYDLVTALKNIAQSTPSKKLSDLMKGLATAIMTGGDLKSFLEKRAETLLLNYRLEREKFTKTAETFMDIYISVVIAAPMILLLLLVMISVSGISIGIGTSSMTLAIILIVALVNILFIVLLGLKQPGY